MTLPRTRTFSLDEPTRGIVSARSSRGLRLINKMVEKAKPCIVISLELEKSSASRTASTPWRTVTSPAGAEPNDAARLLGTHDYRSTKEGRMTPGSAWLTHEEA